MSLGELDVDYDNDYVQFYKIYDEYGTSIYKVLYKN